MNRMMKYAIFLLAALLLAGCMTGPNYQRPAVALPGQFRGAPVQSAPSAQIVPGDASIADTKWQDLFHDPTLQQLVETALKQNFDIQIAAERVQEARAQFDSQRANLFPFLNGQAQFTGERASTIGATPFIPAGTNLSLSYSLVGVGASWELDFWGRLRRLNEAARAKFFAAQDNQLAIRMSLVADVMDTYFMLLEQDRELSIGKQTRDIAENGLKLTTLRHDRGAATGLDVQQANQLLYTATAQIAAAERAIPQTEDALSLLLGQAPADIPRGSALEQIARPASLPPGLPVSLLTRRPDVRKMEEQLVAANAQIGAARALYFPQITLNAFLGGQSQALLAILTGPAREATITPAAMVPIFQAGQIRAGVRLTEAQEREALITYRQTIFTGLRDASDALVSNDHTRDEVDQQALLVRALEESTRLSRLRYEGGLDSFLQVLDSERNLFQGQLVLAQLRLLELQSVVRLYQALGGGWQ
jgi:NodT family efflux transporter outer membrane factor (OMF) lipoprotein